MLVFPVEGLATFVCLPPSSFQIRYILSLSVFFSLPCQLLRLQVIATRILFNPHAVQYRKAMLPGCIVVSHLRHFLRTFVVTFDLFQSIGCSALSVLSLRTTKGLTSYRCAFLR